MPQSLVSVVIPVFNGERFISEAVESILLQRDCALDIIVVDDGSTDATPDILQALADPRLRIIRNERNLGIVGALNRGLSIARGQLIARMDADDVALPDRISRQARFLAIHPEVALVGCATSLIDEEGHEIGTEVYPESDKGIRSIMFVHNPFIHGTVVIRASVLAACGPYDARYLHNEDYDLWLRVASRYRVANLPDVLLRRRVHGGSITFRETVAQTGYRARTIAHAAWSYYRNPVYTLYAVRPAVAYLLRRGRALIQ